MVGGFNPSEKYEFISWDDYSQYMKKQISCSKPLSKCVYLSISHSSPDIAKNFTILGGSSVECA